VLDRVLCKRYTVWGEAARFMLNLNYRPSYTPRREARASPGGLVNMKFWIFFRKFERY